MLMYLCPALMDWLLFFASFAVFYSAGVRGLNMHECAILGIMVQVAYMVSSLVIGRLLNRHNAKTILLASTAMCGIFGIWSLCTALFGLLLTVMMLLGVFAAFFFNSFQTFMRGEAGPGELNDSVAYYTLSWSLGAAFGNITAGYLYKWGQFVMITTIAAVVVLIITLLFRHKTKDSGIASADEHIEEGSANARRVSPSYVLIGWFMIFTVTFVQRPLCTFLPPMFAHEKIGSLMASMPLFAHMAVQALFGLAMIRFRDILYRRTPFWIIQGVGALAFCAIWIWPSYTVCFVVLMLLGVYAGFAYFCAVYYASNSGRRSFNIGINEALVGLGSVAGMFFGEWWMRFSGSESGIYLVCSIGLIVSMFLQVLIATFTGNSSTK
ncbi:MAG: MFS transporter [Kiritimatiellae bacterium]|nr:MFS transporter [Kiritimatiellia bacterium]MDD5519659.1 MFS transporter [Kiritimatiellia bacterium]